MSHLGMHPRDIMQVILDRLHGKSWKEALARWPDLNKEHAAGLINALLGLGLNAMEGNIATPQGKRRLDTEIHRLAGENKRLAEKLASRERVLRTMRRQPRASRRGA